MSESQQSDQQPEKIDVGQMSPHDYETLKNLPQDKIAGNWPIEPLQEEFNFPTYPDRVESHSKMHDALQETLTTYRKQIEVMQKIHDDQPTTRQEREFVAPLLEKLGLEKDAIPSQDLIDRLSEWRREWYETVKKAVLGRGIDFSN